MRRPEGCSLLGRVANPNRVLHTPTSCSPLWPYRRLGLEIFIAALHALVLLSAISHAHAENDDGGAAWPGYARVYQDHRKSWDRPSQ